MRPLYRDDARVAAIQAANRQLVAIELQALGEGDQATVDLIRQALQANANLLHAVLPPSRLVEQRRRDQAAIPDAEAEESWTIHLSIPISLDPFGLPGRDSETFREIAAEHVLEWIEAVDRDPAQVASIIDRTVFNERRRC